MYFVRPRVGSIPEGYADVELNQPLDCPPPALWEPACPVRFIRSEERPPWLPGTPVGLEMEFPLALALIPLGIYSEPCRRCLVELPSAPNSGSMFIP